MISQLSPDKSPFGVLVFLPWNDDWNHHMYPKAKAVRAMGLIQKAGIKWVRMDFSRTQIEPDAEGKFEFARFDWLTKQLRARGLSVVGILGYSPGWAGRERGKWNSPPEDIASFSRYVYETIRRYHGQVDHWEIWNEPNLAQYWEPQDRMETYPKLLKASWEAAKSANPDCHLLNGGLAIMGPDEAERFYATGASKYFDIFNVHLFVGATGIPDIDERLVTSVGDIRRIMERYGDGQKQLWITEIGFHGVSEAASIKTPVLKYKPDERLQAHLLEKTFSAALESKMVDKIFWAFLQDTEGHFPDGADYFGLIRSDFSPKPSYEAYKELIASFQE